MNRNYQEEETKFQRIIKVVCLVIGLPGVIIPFIGLLATISLYVGLFRYWGSWGSFIALMVMGYFESNGCRALAQSLKEKGPDHYDTDVIGALVGLLQYGIIWMCIRTFF